MPIGCYALVPHLVHQLCLQRPKRILDLGIGFGGNGCNVRQWLDLGVRPWRTFLVGVEVWADYRSPLWDLYDVVVVDTIENYLSSCSESFDAILLTDVIEHLEKSQGLRLVDQVRTYVAPDGQLLIGTPAEFFEQSGVYGNCYEEHRSAWRRGDFEQLGFEVSLVGRPEFFCGQAIFAVWRRSRPSCGAPSRGQSVG